MPNIIGLGVDLTEIPRIVSTLERYGTRFMQRIFTEGEIAYCTRRKQAAIHFAGRFASKEAAMKALGTGHSRGGEGRTPEVVGRSAPRLPAHVGHIPNSPRSRDLRRPSAFAASGPRLAMAGAGEST